MKEEVILFKCEKIKNKKFKLLSKIGRYSLFDDETIELINSCNKEWNFNSFINKIDNYHILFKKKKDIAFLFNVDEKPSINKSFWVKQFKRLKAMPVIPREDDYLTLYRGYDCPNGLKGMSWTLDMQTAFSFGDTVHSIYINKNDKRILYYYSGSEEEVVLDLMDNS